ncbi:DUF4405 domain-containing protein [Sulfurospirillum diekertiae]|uniref:Flavinylation-associated cytochrome domain-containing protein n=1 Tax=Sulfurospirillum diekertiae TaxID=1854492 RepID=A0A1Y0HRD7_9BACT|nr:DUF4405 domain-containing protein [Sulfurospirillum diekertiae]ARU50096.1 hypothetical protein Sdiek1_2954 [Sulfurospirillum diekertiae]ASC94884.1 hypothetical protein Sdiek2_2888 [Sulfurospirillum diekertiae]
MNVIPRNILSALLTVMFVVVSITGIMMYFKIRMLSSEALHIWLGFAFVAISCVHLLKNWNGFITYFKKRSTLVSIFFGFFVITAIIIAPLLNPQEKGINPKSKIIGTMMNAPLSKVAAFVDLDEAMMVKVLADKQIIASSKQSVSEIAKANDKTNDDILNIVFTAPNVPE